MQGRPAISVFPPEQSCRVAAWPTRVFHVDAAQEARQRIESDQVPLLFRDLESLGRGVAGLPVLGVVQVKVGEIEESVLAHPAVVLRAPGKWV